jgi:hypothetical protein
MPAQTVSDLEQGWASSNPTLLGTDTSDFRVQGTGSLHLSAHAGAAGVTADFTPAGPLDLSAYDELRMWTYASRPADGTPPAPFLMDLSFVDAADAVGEEHRWLVPVNRRRTWEQHRFGIAGDRRSQVTSWSLRCLTNEPFQLYADELLAVSDGEPLLDVESALTDLLDGLPLPGVTALPVSTSAAAGATTIVVGLNHRLHAGNRIRIDGTASYYFVTAAAHDDGAGTTTLTVQPALAAAVAPGSTITVTAPVRFEETPFHEATDAAGLPDPVVLITLTDQREEPQRACNVPQRDSFRRRGGLTVCSLRPPARPVLVEYQILPAASDRGQSLALRTEILGRVGVDTGLRVNGTVLPVQTLLPPPLDIRVRAVPAPIYLHVGARIDVGPRTEVPWVHQGQLRSGPLDAPWDPRGPVPAPVPDPDDQEGIVLRI